MAFNELYSLVGGGVNTDDANATASQILSGYTAYVKGKKITGNIPSQGAQTITPGTTNKTIASGKYLSGTQTIKGDSNLTAGNIKAGTSIFGVSGTYTSDANAVGWSDLRAGKTAYVNGQRIEGNLASLDQGTPNWCENVRIYNDRFEFAPPPGIHGCWWDGGQYCYMSYEQVRNAIGLTADKLRAGNYILGIWGSYTGTVSAACVILSHQNYDYDDAAQWTVNQTTNIVSHVSTNKGTATFQFTVSARVFILSTFFHYAESGSVGNCSLNGWVDVWPGLTFTVNTYIGGSNAHGNNKRVLAAVSISY